MNMECAWICTKPQNSRLGRSDHIVLVCYRLSTPDPSIPGFILQPATSSHQTISLSKWPFRIRDIREYFWSGHLTTFHFFLPSFTKAKRFVLLILLHMAVRIAVTAKLSPLFTSQLLIHGDSKRGCIAIQKRCVGQCSLCAHKASEGPILFYRKTNSWCEIVD